MILNMEIHQNKQRVLEFLDYQNSESGNKVTCSFKELSRTKLRKSIETLLEEIKPVVTEEIKEFDSRDES